MGNHSKLCYTKIYSIIHRSTLDCYMQYYTKLYYDTPRYSLVIVRYAILANHNKLCHAIIYSFIHPSTLHYFNQYYTKLYHDICRTLGAPGSRYHRFVCLRQTVLPVSPVWADPPPRLIHHSSSVIHHPFISTSLCVFRLTKGTLMGEKKK